MVLPHQLRHLEGPAIRECERPRLADGRDGVHRVQVKSGLLLRLAARQEANGRNGRGNRLAEGHDCRKRSSVSSLQRFEALIIKEPTSVVSHLGSGDSLGALRTRADHIRLEHSSLKKNVVVGKSLVAVGENLLGDLQRLLDSCLNTTKKRGTPWRNARSCAFRPSEFPAQRSGPDPRTGK
jgi:hypothetical protein